MLVAIHDEQAAPQHFGYRVALAAPEQPVARLDEHEARRIRPGHEHRLEARQLNAEHLAECAVKDLNRCVRMSLSQQGPQRPRACLGVGGWDGLVHHGFHLWPLNPHPRPAP